LPEKDFILSKTFLYILFVTSQNIVATIFYDLTIV